MNRDVLIQKTNSIQNCLKRIHETTSGDIDSLSNLDTQDIVVLNLQRAIQASIDMAAYIVSEKKLGAPQSLRETFVILERENILNNDLSSKMQKMVGFRNIAVHAYQSISVEVLKKILDIHLIDFEQFYTAILNEDK